jgi:hypothetical protein
MLLQSQQSIQPIVYLNINTNVRCALPHFNVVLEFCQRNESTEITVKAFLTFTKNEVSDILYRSKVFYF